jgi:hypothetical protein
MSPAREFAPDADDYHSYVVRIRVRQLSTRVAGEPALSIRVEYVNMREAMHFNELSAALEFIADSVRRNVLHPQI